MASVIVFLGYSFLMFQAGYQWCKWSRKGVVGADGTQAQDSGTVWDGMIAKI